MAVSISDFPNELILFVIGHLTLQSLIACRGLSKKWRTLADCAEIDPIRQKLLLLYFEVISSPNFYSTRPQFLPFLIPFDREEMVRERESITGRLPAELRMWLLEWPSRAVFTWAWPGLSYETFPLPGFPRLPCSTEQNHLALSRKDIRPWKYAWPDSGHVPYETHARAFCAGMFLTPSEQQSGSWSLRRPNWSWVLAINTAVNTGKPHHLTSGCYTVYVMYGGEGERNELYEGKVILAWARSKMTRRGWIDYLKHELYRFESESLGFAQGM